MYGIKEFSKLKTWVIWKFQFNQDLNGENAFERKLHDLMLLYGKTSAEVIDLLSKSESKKG